MCITLNKYSFRNKKEGMSAQKLSPNQMGVFHLSKRSLKKNPILCEGFLVLFVWFKISSTPGTFSSFLSAIAHNFTSHKVLFSTHLLPKLILPPQILKRRENVVEEIIRAQSPSVDTVVTNSKSEFLHQDRDNKNIVLYLKELQQMR